MHIHVFIWSRGCCCFGSCFRRSGRFSFRRLSFSGCVFYCLFYFTTFLLSTKGQVEIKEAAQKGWYANVRTCAAPKRKPSSKSAYVCAELGDKKRQAQKNRKITRKCTFNNLTVFIIPALFKAEADVEIANCCVTSFRVCAFLYLHAPFLLLPPARVL